MTVLKGKVVVVTGGASGLGAAICAAVVEAGGSAIVADIDDIAAMELARDLSINGGRASSLRLDVGSEESVARGLESVQAMHGRIDAVVNNAGTDVTLPVSQLAVKDWERVLRTNLHGPFLMTKYALPYLQRAGDGHIVNIASTASRRAWPNASAYHASKWGLLGLSHALHAELRTMGIKVTAIIAGGMRTPFLLKRFPDIDIETLQAPTDVARAVVFALTAPRGSVIAEMTVVPMRETSWP
jgi:NAD(P)-dependent dehydrogenase (short-subunit alcohol dehydrogenase family)